MRYVMEALRLQNKDLASRLGMAPSTLSMMLGGRQTYTTRDMFLVYDPRLTALVERADKSRGEVAVMTDPQSKALNPVSTSAAKEFVLGPYREKVAEYTANRRTDEVREKHRVAMKAYWTKRRTMLLESAKKGIPADKAVLAIPPPKIILSRQGFFRRIFNAILTGFHA